MQSPQQFGLIVAPAGFGKTTLLTQWLDERGHDAAWVTFDPSDDDPAIFWTYIIEALHDRHPAVGSRSLRAVRSPGPLDSTRLGLLILSELETVQEEFFLVLDDLHAITSSSCLDALSQFLQRLPPNVRVILASRTNPRIPTARFRARGQLTELGMDDLRFTADESESMLNGEEGLGLTERDIDLLHHRTEGWPAALYLAARTLQRSPPEARSLLAAFSRPGLQVFEYIHTEVLGELDLETRIFLARTSVVERLAPALADALTGRTDSESLLEDLWRSNRLLVALDEPHHWYRYHPLLREALEGELRRLGEDARALNLMAARWFEAEGLYFSAVEHALRASALEEAARLISEHRVALIRTGLAAPIQKWLDQLPDDVARAVPGLPLLALACLNAFDTDSPAFDRWERVAHEVADTAGSFDAIYDDDRAPLSVFSAVRAPAVGKSAEACVVAARALIRDEAPGTTWWRFGQAQLACSLYLLEGPSAEVAAAARASLDADNPNPYPIADIQALSVLALCALDAGDAVRARSMSDEALARVEEANRETSPQSAMAHIALGRCLAREGQFQQADAEILHALSLRQADPARIWFVHGLVSLAEVRSLGGDLAGAVNALAKARRLLPMLKDPGALPSMLAAVECSMKPLEAPLTLSRAETRVLRLLAGPLSQRDIGRELYLSRNTVKSHTRSLYRKLGVATRADAVAAARARGWLA